MDNFYKECGLCAASLRGHANIVRLLLQYGGIPTRECFEVACLGGFTKIVKLLLETGVQYDYSIGSANSSGHTDVVQVLLDAGGNPTAIERGWKYEHIVWDDDSDDDNLDDGWPKN